MLKSLLFQLVVMGSHVATAAPQCYDRGFRIDLSFSDDEFRGGSFSISRNIERLCRVEAPVIRRVEVLAKSPFGRSWLELGVGPWTSLRQIVKGRRSDYFNPSPLTFSVLRFFPHNRQGEALMYFTGNVKIREISVWK